MPNDTNPYRPKYKRAHRERDAYRQCLRDVKGYLLSNTWTRPEIAEYIDRVLDGESTHIGVGPDTPRFDE